MAHPFEDDKRLPGVCGYRDGDCGLPAANRVHASPEAVEHAVKVLTTTRVQESLDGPVPAPSVLAKAVIGAKGARRTVLQAIANAGTRGVTDKELVRVITSYPENTIRPRRKECLDGGLIRPRLDASGRVSMREDAQVWVLTDEGRVALGQTVAA